MNVSFILFKEAQTAMTLAIQFDNVSKHFSNTFAVQQVSFDIKQGSIVALLGHNGAGKSTSLSMLLGLMRPSTGKVSVLGHSPTSGRTRAIAQQLCLSEGTVRNYLSDILGKLNASSRHEATLVAKEQGWL
jgi:ABC-type multidrug transport system ATPase subunit